MDLAALVRGLKLGSDVAEQDSQLAKYFVKNATYFDVVDDEYDVILGPKGSGKSAISRTLVDPNWSPADQVADVEIIPAFNLQGSSIFRRLSTEIGTADEGALRTAWTIYVLALIGNHLVDNHWNGYVEDVSRRLDQLGLRYEQDRPKTVWSSVISSLRKIKPSKVEASLTVAGIGEASGSAEFGLASGAIRPVDWESLLELEVAALQSLNRRCWVVFDRLDEAFPNDRELEKTALRALLHTHRDVCSYGATIKTKLFLRTDLLDRITQDEGFVNATHLRLHRIEWDKEAIIDFVARRFLGSPEVAAFLGIDEAFLESRDGRAEGFDLLIPPNVGGGGSTDDGAGERQRRDSYGWLLAYTSDASRAPNPRNILILIREARSRQMQICLRENPTFEEVGSILSKQAVRGAMWTLSKKRVDDTLLAEFEDLQPWLDAMRGRPFTYTPAQFASTMGYEDVNDPNVAWAIERLKYAGVFAQAPSGQLTVPILYRNGLGLQDRGGSRGGNARNGRARGQTRL